MNVTISEKSVPRKNPCMDCKEDKSTSRLQKIFSLCIFYLENAVLSYANKIHVAFVAMEAIFSPHFIVFLLDFVFFQISML